jgi:hypothetical protein
MRRWVGLAVAVALLGASSLRAGVIDRQQRPPANESRTWLAWGGETTFHFNPDELVRLGLRIESAAGASRRIDGAPGKRYGVVAFPAQDASPLEIRHEGRAIEGIGGGALRHAGGLVLADSRGAIDLRGFSLRASAGTRVGLDVVGSDGTVWFTADHAHYGFDDAASSTFSMRHMNLRLAPALAARLGRPELAGAPVGGLEFHAHAFGETRRDEMPAGGVCNAPWPDPPATHADVELVDGDFSGFSDDVYVKRCAGCSTSSTNGTLVVNQDSSLRNAGDTAVAWYGKFEGVNPPYGNDQHPFLVWNLYRLDADGGVRQIGVSGVKHAFYTINYNCPCSGGNVLYPTCEDVYSSYNNDSSTDIGPRSEIIPHTGQWGRCGSVYDADCNGVQDQDGGAQDLYEFRMNVVESDLQPPLSTGAHYFQEYWYVARDDDSIYNSMGWREVAFQKSGANWSVSLVGGASDFTEGPYVDTWVDPSASDANHANTELSTALGRARVAVVVTSLGSGQWRYRYVAMNLDYAHAEIDPAHPTEPNLMVDSAHGFKSFRVPVASGVSASAFAFGDADTSAANDWTASASGGYVTWTAPANQNPLDWGKLYTFELVANVPPATGDIGLVGVATSSEPELPYSVSVRVPGAGGGNDLIFRNGFD